MKHFLLLVFLVSLALTAFAGLGLAQAEGQGAGTGDELSDAETAGQVRLTGESVAEMAQFVAGLASESGSVPDWVQTLTTSGHVQRLSATDAFVVLARALSFWDANARLPENVPVVLGAVTPPVLATEDLPDPQREVAPTKEIPTDLFVSQAKEVLRRIDQFHLIPTAVGVGGQRLSAVQYLAGLAVAVGYAYRHGKLGEALYLPDLAAPAAWVAHTKLVAERVPRPSPEGDDDVEAAPARSGPLPPMRSQETEVPAAPTLTLFPASGKVTGAVDLGVDYSGPTAKFVLFQVDGETKGITNTPPYGYRLDTTKLAPGPHQVLVRVLGEGDAEIIRTHATYIVTGPPPPAASRTPAASKPAAAKPPAPKKAARPAPKKP